MLVLGIETSCDDTAVALYRTGEGLVVEKRAAQLEHGDFGGVVPEIASRAHLRTLMPLFSAALAEAGLAAHEIDGIGVTNRPGLIGALLVGTAFAKGLALALDRPLVGVHHLEAHLLALRLEREMTFPAVALVVSGGHTELVRIDRIGRYRSLGRTRDDAAGEAFDKIAKLLGLGYPGGPALERAARGGDPEAVAFPRAMMDRDDFDFSFSGLKTAVRLHLDRLGRIDEARRADLAASAQEAIVDVLVKKTVACARREGVSRIVLAGGVAANGRLRSLMAEEARRHGIVVEVPSPRFCTDNAAMIAATAERLLQAGIRDDLALDAAPRSELLSWA
jgi:N6-L-threonylcarbamoyladenine synthase